MRKKDSSQALRSVVREISEVAGYLWKRGWAESSAGNLSVDVTELISKGPLAINRSSNVSEEVSSKALAGRTFLMTAAGSRFRDLARAPEENLLLIQIAEGHHSYWTLKRGMGIHNRPTSELTTHLRIHEFLTKNRSQYKVVLHAHPTHLIALTHLETYGSEKAVNRHLRETLPEIQIVLPEGVGYAPYRSPGSTSLAEVTVRSLRQRRVVLWEKHGCTAIGRDPLEAFDLIDMVNKGAEIFFFVQRSVEKTKRERKQA